MLADLFPRSVSGPTIVHARCALGRVKVVLVMIAVRAVVIISASVHRLLLRGRELGGGRLKSLEHTGLESTRGD